MTWQRIPTGTDPDYEQVTTLEGSHYLLRFSFNQRCATWYLSIATEEGEHLVDGLKLVCYWPLTRKVADERMPQGEMLVVSSTSDTSPPGITDLGPGGRCTLVYVPSSDMP